MTAEAGITCPWCGRVNELHDSVQDPKATPGPGDVAICWGCRKISIFVRTTEQRRATDEEVAALRTDRALRVAADAVRWAYSPADVVRLVRGRRNP